MRDLLAKRPSASPTTSLRQGRQAGVEPADEIDLLRGGIQPNIVLLRSATRVISGNPQGEGNERYPGELHCSHGGKKKNLCVHETTRWGYPDEPGDGGGADGAAPAGARLGPAAVGAEGGVPARRAVEVLRGAAALARRLQDQVGGSGRGAPQAHTDHAAARRPHHALAQVRRVWFVLVRLGRGEVGDDVASLRG